MSDAVSAPAAPPRCRPRGAILLVYVYGRMFWFMRKRLSGSYFRLISTSLS